MRDKSRSADAKAARVAGRQQGVIDVSQLLEAGLTRHAISRRVKKGVLHPEYPGVYRFGHRAPSTEARYLAAALACGEGAVLSGMAAAFVHRLIKGRAPNAEVTTTRDRNVRGVATRRVRRLERADITVVRGIPITKVPRTLVDLAANLPLVALGRACHEAQVQHRTRANEVEVVLERRPRTPGGWKLRRIFEGDFHITLSELERAVLRLVRGAGLPLPETNRNADGHYVDCRWPEHRLTVEIDSYRYHHTRHAWERDRRREREARRRGDEFRRYSYDDVTEDGEAVVVEVAALLAR